MKSMTMTLMALIVATWFSVWALEAAGGVLIVETTTTADAPVQTHQIQIDRDWMRMEHTISGEKAAFVFDGAKQAIRIVNYDRKAYNEMTKAEVDRLSGHMADAMAQMQEQLKKLPPEQRAVAEARMRGRGMGALPPKTVFRRAGTDTVGRWTCDKYEGYQNEQKTSELCTVDPAVLGFVASDFEVSRKLAELFKKLVPQNSDNVFILGKAEEQGFSGVPVRRVLSPGRRPTITEMTEVSRQSFPPSTFDVPAGFIKKSPGQR